MSNVMDVAFVSKGNVSTTIYEISKENDAVLCEEDEVTTVATFVWGTGSGWIFADAIKDVIADETDGGKVSHNGLPMVPFLLRNNCLKKFKKFKLIINNQYYDFCCFF